MLTNEQVDDVTSCLCVLMCNVDSDDIPMLERIEQVILTLIDSLKKEDEQC